MSERHENTPSLNYDADDPNSQTSFPFTDELSILGFYRQYGNSFDVKTFKTAVLFGKTRTLKDL